MSRGAKETEKGKRDYYTCSNGVFVKRMENPTEKTIERTLSKGPNIGKVVHELHFGAISGRLLSIEKEVSEYGPSWKVVLDTSTPQDPESQAVISLAFSGSYSRSILLRLPNVNLEEDIELKPYAFTPKGETKEKKGIVIYQNGRKVDAFYTKENKNGLPELKEVQFQGKTQWDDYDMMQFLEGMVKGLNLKPAEKATEIPDPAPEKSSAQAMEDFEKDILNDGEVPF